MCECPLCGSTNVVGKVMFNEGLPLMYKYAVCCDFEYADCDDVDANALFRRAQIEIKNQLKGNYKGVFSNRLNHYLTKIRRAS